MLPEERSFFIRGDDGGEYGPVDLAELRDWVRENRAGLGTVVRLDEPEALWQPWQYYPELVALLAEVRSTSPAMIPAGLVVAPLWKRVLAFVADVMLAIILVLPIWAVLGIALVPDWFVQVGVATLQQPPAAVPEPPTSFQVLTEVVKYTLVTLYMGAFHAAHGKTPAKSLLHLRVVDRNGENPAPAQALLRGFILSISMYLFCIPLTYAFFNPQRRAFHDYVAGTYVVEEGRLDE